MDAGNFDIATLGELLIDFTDVGESGDGRKLFERNPGGAPANVAVNASRLGARCAFIGKVGDDVNGRFLKRVLDAEGVDSSALFVDPTCQTTLSFVELAENGERAFSFARRPGADMLLTAGEVGNERAQNVIQRSRILHIGSFSLTDEPARTATFEAVAAARKAGALISFDPNYRAKVWSSESEATRLIRSAILKADLVKVSLEECGITTGENDPEAAAARLLDQGVKLGVITLGEAGALVFCPEGTVHVAAQPVACVDATGAGDAYWAGFLAAFLAWGKGAQDVPLRQVVMFGQAGAHQAATCIQHRGAL